MKNSLNTMLANAALIALTVTAAFVIGSQIPKLAGQFRGNVKNGNFALHVANQPQRLTLYGTMTCPHCIRAREFLSHAGIPFNDRILDASPETRNMFSTLNEDGVPVLVSSTGLVSGFNAAAFAELARASAQQ